MGLGFNTANSGARNLPSFPGEYYLLSVLSVRTSSEDEFSLVLSPFFLSSHPHVLLPV